MPFSVSSPGAVILKRDDPEAGEDLSEEMRLAIYRSLFLFILLVFRRLSYAGFNSRLFLSPELRAISTARLSASPRLHLQPIYVVVFNGP